MYDTVSIARNKHTEISWLLNDNTQVRKPETAQKNVIQPYVTDSTKHYFYLSFSHSEVHERHSKAAVKHKINWIFNKNSIFLNDYPKSHSNFDIILSIYLFIYIFFSTVFIYEILNNNKKIENYYTMSMVDSTIW